MANSESNDRIKLGLIAGLEVDPQRYMALTSEGIVSAYLSGNGVDNPFNDDTIKQMLSTRFSAEDLGKYLKGYVSLKLEAENLSSKTARVDKTDDSPNSKGSDEKEVLSAQCKAEFLKGVKKEADEYPEDMPDVVIVFMEVHNLTLKDINPDVSLAQSRIDEAASDPAKAFVLGQELEGIIARRESKKSDDDKPKNKKSSSSYADKAKIVEANQNKLLHHKQQKMRRSVAILHGESLSRKVLTLKRLLITAGEGKFIIIC